MVFIAVAGPGGTASRELALTGDRQAIRTATVESALDLLIGTIREDVS
jgi:nicotinamide mononucleotide (NMN) deamidase PncC